MHWPAIRRGRWGQALSAWKGACSFGPPDRDRLPTCRIFSTKGLTSTARQVDWPIAGYRGLAAGPQTGSRRDRSTLDIQVFHEVGFVHDHLVALGGVFAQKLLEGFVGFELGFDVDPQQDPPGRVESRFLQV